MELLVAEHVEKNYSGYRALDAVSIAASEGRILGLLGPNGAGKTTSFYMVMGLIRPDAGTLKFRGVDITYMPMFRRARMMISKQCLIQTQQI